MTKKHSWGGKGLGNQSSRKDLYARKKEQWERDGKPREESEIRVVGAERIVHICNRDEVLENCSGWQPAQLGQGTCRRPISARNQGVSLGPCLICSPRGQASEKGSWVWRMLMSCKHSRIARHLPGERCRQRCKGTEKQQTKQKIPRPWSPI